MKEAVRKGILAGIGLADFAVEVAKSAIDALVKSGEMTAEQGRKALDHLSERGSREGEALRKQIEERVESILEGMNLVTVSRFQEHEARLVKLEEAIDKRVAGLERDVDLLMNRQAGGV